MLAMAGGGGLLVGLPLVHLPLVVDGASLGTGDLFGDFAEELHEGGDGGGGEVRARDADVGVEVGGGVGEDFVVLLGPLGRADEAFFFGVPTGDDDGAGGLPALLEESAEAVDGFEHGGGAAVGVDGAVDPGVAMIAGYDPIVGVVGAGNGADDVPDGAEGNVLIEMHVDGDVCGGCGVGSGAGSRVIGEGERALPVARRLLAAERFEDRSRVFVGERVGGNDGLVALKLVEWEGGGRQAGREWRRCRVWWGRRGRWGGTEWSRAGRRIRDARDLLGKRRRGSSRRRRGRSK